MQRGCRSCPRSGEPDAAGSEPTPAGRRTRRRVRRRAMMRRIGVIALVALVGCTAAERLPPPPTGVAAIGVAPVENKTGSKLVVSGDSYVAKFIGMEKRTVPDVLGKELEKALVERGFAVGGGSAPQLK